MKAKSVTRGNMRPKKSFSIVGIGASAGGLEAFRALLEALPPLTGVAYVLVQHLDPRHESMLAELLARATEIPVIEVKHRLRVQPNHIYVISPDKNIALQGDTLIISTRSKEVGLINMPIDHFFLSLAAQKEDRAIGVVLSGTASDGTIGLRAIKEAGGLTFAQDSTAKYQGMPQSTVASGVVDYVLPPKKIAEEIIALMKYPLTTARNSPTSKKETSETDDYRKIIAELLRSTGVDFSHYKTTTLLRRITRRMIINKTPTPLLYYKYMRGNSSEVEALFNDILIHVSGFFRDLNALQTLVQKIFLKLIENKPPKEPLRIWVAGCATGEEVYTLAICLLEFMSDRSLSRPLQIFGTDLSPIAIERARRGIYTRSDVGGISVRRLERYFLKTNGSYQIRKDVRDICVFSVHNLLKDPPFSRMDIVSCCNVLIYMDAVLHSKIFSAFYYALLPKGVLVLGKSEAVGSAPGLFTQVEKKSKVFIKKVGSKHTRLTVIAQSEQTANIPHTPSKIETAIAAQASIQDEADAMLVGRFAPASVLINNSSEIMQFRGITQEYLTLPTGKATLNLLKIVREGLVHELRDAILKTKRTGRSIKKEVIESTPTHTHTTIIEVIPLKNASEDAHYLVVFQSAPMSMAATPPPGKHVSGSRSSKMEVRRIEHLERELIRAREDTRSFAEEQEAATEELQSANEEILSSNEELQSLNEELETSGEELESTNEELNTINQELQTRNEEVTEARDYAESIIATIRNPFLILDKELRVKTANSAFYRAFRTTKEETEGHFLYNLGNNQWDIPKLRELLQDILPKNNVVDDYEITHDFPVVGHRIFYLNAYTLFQKSERKLILLAFEDVTEQKEINRQKDEFIGIASHEIKTPITSIKTFTELLQEKLSGATKKEYSKILEHIVIQSDRLTTLVTDLLSSSQMQAGKFLLNKERFDLDELIERTVNAMQESTPHHTIVKEGGLEQRVVADASRIEQVLINLLTNAVKYSPNGKRVIVRVTESAREVVVSVQDFGMGIAKKDHKTIFERFYRGKGKQGFEKSTGAEGFGLGLYITSEIIEKHDGKIWVESEPEKGSTFFFTLPLPQQSKPIRRRNS